MNENNETMKTMYMDIDPFGTFLIDLIGNKRSSAWCKVNPRIMIAISIRRDSEIGFSLNVAGTLEH